MNYTTRPWVFTYLTNIIRIDCKKKNLWRGSSWAPRPPLRESMDMSTFRVEHVRIRSPAAGSSQVAGPVPINIITTGALATPTTIITVYQWQRTVEGLLNWWKIHIFIERARGPCAKRKALDGVWNARLWWSHQMIKLYRLLNSCTLAPRTHVRGGFDIFPTKLVRNSGTSASSYRP